MVRRCAGSTNSTRGWSCPITSTQSPQRMLQWPPSCDGSKGELAEWPTRFWDAQGRPSGKTSHSTTGYGLRRSASFDMLSHFPLQCMLLAIRNHYGANLPAALKDSHHSGFVLRSRSGNPATALRNVHVPRLTPDERLIHFNMPRQFRERSMMQGIADAVCHVPR